MTAAAPGTSSLLPRVELRPQSVLLTFFGDYLADPPTVVSTAGIVTVLAATGVGEHAARATASRMVKRGLLRRRTSGRRAYFGLTDFGRTTVLGGRERAHDRGAPDDEWDGTWTFVAFSLPEEAQRERHELRALLTWAGFGMVQSGLWAAPRRTDVIGLVSDPAVRGGLRVFQGCPQPPLSGPDLVRQAFDLTALADQHAGFLSRWSPLVGLDLDALADPLAARTVLATDWLQVIRDDPRLPAAFLGEAWPGAESRRLYLDLDARLRRRAEAQVRGWPEVIEEHLLAS